MMRRPRDDAAPHGRDGPADVAGRVRAQGVLARDQVAVQDDQAGRGLGVQHGVHDARRVGVLRDAPAVLLLAKVEVREDDHGQGMVGRRRRRREPERRRRRASSWQETGQEAKREEGLNKHDGGGEEAIVGDQKVHGVQGRCK